MRYRGFVIFKAKIPTLSDHNIFTMTGLALQVTYFERHARNCRSPLTRSVLAHRTDGAAVLTHLDDIATPTAR